MVEASHMHQKVAGPIPSRGMCRRQPTDTCCSHLSLPLLVKSIRTCAQVRIRKKVKYKFTYDLAIALSGIYPIPKRNANVISTKDLYLDFPRSNIHNSQKSETVQMLSNRRTYTFITKCGIILTFSN